MEHRAVVADALAQAFLAGDWEPESMARGWLLDLARAARAGFPEPPLDAPRRLAAFLAAFLASISASRVFGLFRTAGYPEPVAHALTALVTGLVVNARPRRPAGRVRPAQGHRPQRPPDRRPGPEP